MLKKAMKKSVGSVTAFLFILFAILVVVVRIDDRTSTRSQADTSVPVGQSGNWNLIFDDEFNGTTLDTSKWLQLRGDAAGPYGDPANPDVEDAYYTKNNSYVSNGNLVLNLVKQAAGGYPYSSGWVQTYPAFTYTYGYAEIRAKVPTCDGCWPAFWTVPTPLGTWPPEIDIFEFFNEPFPSFNYHYGTASNHKQSGPTNYGTSGVDYTKDYHVYGMSWEPNKIQVFLDGQPGPSYTDAATITSLPQFLILNLALNKGYNPTTTQMLVDYVRVWQKGSGSTTTPTAPSTVTSAPTTKPGTKLGVQLVLHGLGKGGDSINPSNGGNTNPRHPQRSVTVDLFDIQNQQTTTKTGTVTYASASGKFTGTLDVGNQVNGSYIIKVKSDQFLRSQVAGMPTTKDGVTVLPETTLISGDVNGDNALNILDYNIILGCFSDLAPAQSCTISQQRMADLTDDGKVNQLDYNLFLREVATHTG